MSTRRTLIDPREILSPRDMDRAIAALGPEPKACPLCEAGEPRKLFAKSGKDFFECRACELVFVHAIYPEFAQDTDHLETTYHFGEVQVAKPGQVRKMERLLREFRLHRKTGKLLEVGCGQGLFLHHAREDGWDVRGVDVLPEVVEVATQQRGLDVHLGELFDAAHPDDTFDVVYMSEVIEHIVEPIPLLAEIHRVLRPGGIALLGTGNAQSWSARLRGKRWDYYLFGGHLHIRFYGPKSARVLAERAGFASVECRTRGFALRESEEMRGAWYKPLFKLAQGFVSPLAGPLGAGHRLRMIFHKGPPGISG